MTNGGQMRYTYDAAGIKLSQQTIKGNEITNRHYVGGLQYEQKLSQQRIVKEWSFNTSAEGWTAPQHILNYTWHSGGHIKGKFSGTDPILRSPAAEVLIHKNIAVRLRMRVVAGGVQRAQLYFTTASETAESTARSMEFALAPDSTSYYEYLIPMGELAGWNGTLKTLRLDPQHGNSSGFFWIDYIQLVELKEEQPLHTPFMQTAEGRVMLSSTGGKAAEGEYQYHFKDHLGNVRLSFSTLAHEQAFKAAFEDEVAEEQQFSGTNDEYALQGKIVSKPLFNRTPGGSKVLAFNASEQPYTPGYQRGLAKKIAVSQGDVITLEVYAKYLNLNEQGGLDATKIMAALTGGAGYTIGFEGSSGATTITSATGAVAYLGGSRASGSVPLAYLSYYQLDANGKSVTSGLKQVSAAAAVTDPASATGPHERLYFQLTADRDGYILAELTHDANENIEVYFDDFSLSSYGKKATIIQEDSYYPFGMTFNSYQREGSLENKYKFNGKEAQDDWGMADFGARFYDPALGRWHVLDPLAEVIPGISPYVFTYNNPVLYKDPSGMIGETDMQGRDRFDSFTGQYVAPMDRPGGLSPQVGFDHFRPKTDQERYNSITSDDIAGGFDIVKAAYTPDHPEYGIYFEVKARDGSAFHVITQYSNNGIAQNGGGNSSDLDALDYLSLGVGAAGTYYGAVGDAFYSNYHWVQGNGKIRLASSAGNNYLLNRSKEITKLATKGARSLSKGLGVAGVVISVANFAFDPTYANGFDMVMGATAFIPGVGWVISGTYFISNTITTAVTGQTIGEHLFGDTKIYGE